MNGLTLRQRLRAEQGLQEAVKALRDGGRTAVLSGAADGAWALLAQHLAVEAGRPLLVVAADPDGLLEELLPFAGEWRPALYPAADVFPMDRVPPSDEIVGARLETQAALLEAVEASQPALVFASPQALMRPALAPDAFRKGVLRIVAGQTIPLERLVAWLLEWGFVRGPQVGAPGEFAVRGGIVDVFPAAGTTPLRLEYFGAEIESIRGFDVPSQASISRREEVTLLPAREFPLRRSELPIVLERLQALDLSRCLPEVAEAWRGDIARLQDAGYFPGVESLYPYLSDQPHTLLDYFSDAPAVLLFEPDRLDEQARRHFDDMQQLVTQEAEHGELPRGLSTGLVAYDAIRQRFGRTVIVERAAEGAIDLGWSAPAPVVGQVEALGARLRDQLHGAAEAVLLVSRQEQRLRHLLGSSRVDPLGLEDIDADSTPLRAGAVSIFGAGLRSGFQLPQSGLTVYSELELFGTTHRPVRRKPRTSAAEVGPEGLFHLDMEPGQLVVHEDHGIGVYRGLQSIDDGGAEHEYIAIEFAGGDKVFVPVEHMDRVQRYLGGGEEEPRLSRLGTGDWTRTKRRVRHAVAAMAQELLEVYARREVSEGHAFSPDGPWQRELEMSFPYDETADQLRVMDEIEADMEQPRPMDRLLCGDVGFGKTELALRAAFKAAVDGKQVAILVPTTVLAQQHYMTFTERLKPFPLRVEVLSRFRSEEESAGVLAGLADGTVDIVIGTHRLLSPRLKFKDLGVLIVDEEQRFGVAQKEQLKRMRASLDVLSMSATPIPRTLHMALGGIRDLSILGTGPEDRLPIRTFVTADDDALITEVTRRELQRQGQVFFVHNRVRTIKKAADRVKQLVPEARLAVAHGQMDEDVLARVMVDFVKGDYDVLVCTKIIESGLDIPNANTLLVERADTFGLAELYQLRGRVGRSGRRAYAYFLYDPQRSLTEGADKRLDAIGEFQELGSGLKLAFRDLEIRGAGNLLGREQSGEIVAVGLEMYQQMLRQAVAELARGGGREQVTAATDEREARPPAVTPLVLPLDHYLPQDYVPGDKVRLQVYQELAAAREDSQIAVLARRLRDRFGPPPAPADNLLYSLRVKLAAQRAGLTAVGLHGGDLELRLAGASELSQLAQGRRGVRVSPSRITFKWRETPNWKEELLRLLDEIARARTGDEAALASVP